MLFVSRMCSNSFVFRSDNLPEVTHGRILDPSPVGIDVVDQVAIDVHTNCQVIICGIMFSGGRSNRYMTLSRLPSVGHN